MVTKEARPAKTNMMVLAFVVLPGESGVEGVEADDLTAVAEEEAMLGGTSRELGVSEVGDGVLGEVGGGGVAVIRSNGAIELEVVSSGECALVTEGSAMEEGAVVVSEGASMVASEGECVEEGSCEGPAVVVSDTSSVTSIHSS